VWASNALGALHSLSSRSVSCILFTMRCRTVQWDNWEFLTTQPNPNHHSIINHGAVVTPGGWDCPCADCSIGTNSSGEIVPPPTHSLALALHINRSSSTPPIALDTPLHPTSPLTPSSSFVLLSGATPPMSPPTSVQLPGEMLRLCRSSVRLWFHHLRPDCPREQRRCSLLVL
jgi:hypothetical protein